MVYNVDLKKARGPVSFGIIFTLVGLVFFAIMVVLLIGNVNKKNALDAETKATNVVWEEHYDSEDGSLMYSPIYEYVVDGNVYMCNSSTSSSSKGGDGIVYYNSKNPSECMTDFDNSSTGIIAIFLIIPVVFLIVGIVQIKKSISKSKIAKELAKSGVLVKNLPYNLVNSNISVNNVPLKCIYTTYKFPDGILREIKSEALKGHILSDADGMCDLLYDPNNYDNYFIDFEITTTGIGNPNIIYYNPNEQGNVVNNNYGNYNNDVNGYVPNNKF